MPISSDIIALLSRQGDPQAAGALRQGEIAAQEAARKQALWASIIGTGVNIATNLPGQIAQMRDMRALADERRAKVQAAQMDMQGRAALGQTIHDLTDPQTGHADPQKVADTLSAKGFPQVANAWLKTNTENAESLDKLRKMEEDRSKAQLALVGDLAYSAGDDPDKFAAGLGLLATHKVIDPKTALQFGELTQSDDWKVLRDKVLPLSPKWQAEQAEKNKPQKVAPGEKVIMGGNVIAEGGPKPMTNEAELAADAANPQSPTAARSAAALQSLKAVTPYQQAQLAQEAKRDPLIAAQTAEARAQAAKANAEVNQPPPNLTPEGLDAVALSFAKTGQLPPMGFGKKAAELRTQIINRAAEMNPNLDLATNRASFQANEGALKQLQKQRDAIGSFEQTAKKNIDLFLEQAGKVVDTGSPMANALVRNVSGKMLGSPDVAAFNAARQVAVNEIAKITTNPNLSGQLSDAARKEVEGFNPASATLKQSVAVMRVLKRDMDNRTSALDDQISAIKGRIGGKASEPSGGDADLVKRLNERRKSGG